MNVLFATGIYPPDTGGPATYTRFMARAFAERGHRVEVICYADDGRSSKDEEAFKVHRISRSLALPIRYALFAWKVFRRVRVMKADTVFLLGSFCEGFPGTIGACLAGKRTVMKIPGDYAWEVYQGAGHWALGAGMKVPEGADYRESLDEFVKHGHGGKIGWIERMEHWAAKRAAIVISPSQYLLRIVEAWGVSTDRIRVIYNAVHAMASSRNREAMREAFGINGKRVLFWGGRAVPWKQADFLIRLMPRLPDEMILVIAGEGPALAFWREEAERLRLGDRVRFIGKLTREEVADWYAASDCFVLPSEYEGFPHMVPEATFAGLPCIVSDRGGNPETKTLLGPSITVLPYLDEETWINALRGEWIRPQQGDSADDRLRFETMVEETVSLLRQL